MVMRKKKKDCDEPHVMPNKKTQPIQWTERLSGALVIVGSVIIITLDNVGSVT